MPLFETVDDALAAVRQDLMQGFEGIFVPLDDPSEALSPVGVFADDTVGAEDVSVMAWEWRVVHAGPLQGTPATGIELTIRGMTAIDGRRGEPQFSRYIDWLGLYADLGAVTIARPPVEDRSDLPDKGHLPYPVDDAG
jgi:hypothetical protein